MLEMCETPKTKATYKVSTVAKEPQIISVKHSFVKCRAEEYERSNICMMATGGCRYPLFLNDKVNNERRRTDTDTSWRLSLLVKDPSSTRKFLPPPLWSMFWSS